MTLRRFVLQRALYALLLVFVVSSGALLLTRLAPGDAITQELLTLTPAERVELRARLGLDRPLGAQYLDWLAGLARLDLGWSVVFSRPVADLLSERALNTALLAAVALAAATLLGIPLGIYTGIRTGDTLAAAVRIVSLILLSVPPLIASLALVLLAARTGWFPIGGMTSSRIADASWGMWLGDLVRHVPLPALALCLPLAATLERLQSQSMARALAEPFVHAAQARGLSRDRAAISHGWRVSLGSVLGFYGLMIGSLFSGSFVVEVVTAWPGLGRLMYDAIRGRDMYLVAGCAAAGSCFIAIGTFAADLLQVAADPRQRPGARA